MSEVETKMTHAAVKVTSVKDSVEFFTSIFGFKPAWQQDDWGMVKGNGATLALIEKTTEVHPPHIGFVVDSKESVDTKYNEIKDHPKIKKIFEPKDHRDQSRSFYFQDNDDNYFEVLWIPDNMTR